MTSQNSPQSNTTTSSETTVFAKTTYRNQLIPFGIKPADRLAHIYVIGKTGTGKSTLLETVMTDDLKKGRGFALLDPHGDLVKKMYQKAGASDRVEDLLYLDASDPSQPFGFNPVANVSPEKRPLAASGIIHVFKHLWGDSWGPRLEHILRNCLLSLLDHPGSTLADILPLLSDKRFRLSVMNHITNPQVRDFWSKEYAGYPPRLRAEAIAPIQNKVGAFLTHPILKKILTEPERILKFRQIMDEGKILLVNLAKGSLGEDTCNLLGSLIVSRFELAALSRENVPEEKRRMFTLVIDEFHNFTTDSLAQMISDLRKQSFGIIASNQFLSQVSPLVRDAILGNVGTIIVFRIGATDAEYISLEFVPEYKITDFTNLPNYHIYLKMMIDGKVSRPFSAVTLPPEPAL